MFDRPGRQPRRAAGLLCARPQLAAPRSHACPSFFEPSTSVRWRRPARFDLAEPIPGPTTSALCTLARETGMAVVGSIFERRAAGLYHNTAVVIDSDGTLRGRYRKMHIPDDPLY